MVFNLLGNQKQNQLQALLGEYYDPRQARMQWIGGTLQGLGLGLATGEPGAWAEGAIAGGTEGAQNYRQQALAQYGIAERKKDQEWQAKERARQEEEWASEDATNQQFNSLLGTIPEGPERAWAQMDPKGYFANKYGQRESKAPSSVQEYQYAVNQGFKGSFMDYEASKRGGMALTFGPDGQVTFQQGSNMKPMTEGQSKDTVYATRAEGALPYVDGGNTALTNPYQVGAGNVPVFGNYLTSKDYQIASSAGKEFLQALLRKDTGATIQPFEIQEYGSVYLPQPGDRAETLAYKKEARHRALAAMKAGMTPQAILAQEKALATAGASGGAGPSPDSNQQTQQPQANIPQEAISELMADPSPAAMQEFDAVFGAGAAAQILGGR